MPPKISVIIPVYKVEPYIRQCLDSIVNQTYQNLEIIIIDDGSPDNCGAICDDYAVQDARIIVIHKENGGLSSARNEGIKRATGKWIAFVDSDDWCELDYFERLIDSLSTIDCELDVFWAGGCYREFPQKTEVNRTTHFDFVYDVETYRGFLIDRVLYFGPPWDKLFRKDFLRESGIRFDPLDKANEDVWFNFLVHNEAKMVAGCQLIGYHWRVNPVSITHGYNPQKAKYCYQLIEKMNEAMRKYPYDPQIKMAINKRAIPQILTSARCYFFHPLNKKPYRTVAKEWKTMKTWTYYHEAIWCKRSRCFTIKQTVAKYVLRLPWFWPFKVLYVLNQRIKGES